jgi:hypothetical protein
MKRRIVVVLQVLLLGVAGCSGTDGPSSGNTPREMFEHLIQKLVPASVRNLQGVGDTWQGYSIYLRFNASEEFIDSLIAAGYKPAAWSEVASHFKLPKGYDKFEPGWTPDAIEQKECYEAEVSNDWTGTGTHYLLIDRSTGTVYFYGVGA